VASNLGPDRYGNVRRRTNHFDRFREWLRQGTSSYEYRITGRGGKGIVAMAVNQRNGKLVASMPVEDGDEIMLVTNGGQLIRCPVDGIRIAGRGTQGVIVFDTAAGEEVVAVERITEEDSPRSVDEEPSAEGQSEEDGG
jgi:DNA gyrase subunit A